MRRAAPSTHCSRAPALSTSCPESSTPAISTNGPGVLSYRGRFPLAANPEGYLYGDLHEFNGWAGYSWIKGLTTTFRVNATTQGEIRGLDPMIRGKAQAANPNFYGGQRVELWGGATISGGLIGQDALTIALEAGIPGLSEPQRPAALQELAGRHGAALENLAAPRRECRARRPGPAHLSTARVLDIACRAWHNPPQKMKAVAGR